MGLQDTPRANRLHIGIMGKVNSGKSSFLNVLTRQNVSIVSNVEGTTTDPIYKAMEWEGIGPIVWIDTAGFIDQSELGKQRMEKTKTALEKCDMILFLCEEKLVEEERRWIKQIQEKKIPLILILHKIDQLNNMKDIQENLFQEIKIQPLCVSSKLGIGFDDVKEAILRNLPETYELESITSSLCNEKDVILLVMPQDIQAPKGRLILPQVQTIRDLLDHKCVVISTTLETYLTALRALHQAPTLIICDSQVFAEVYKNKPLQSKLTSFSILFAQYKGDINTFVSGAKAIAQLNVHSKVLIAEACTHAPLSEDIGRVKIPQLLRKRFGESMKIDIVSGNDFSDQLHTYDLIIHCGACMFNRKYVLSRIDKAKAAGVPITNYGVTIAYLKGILDEVVL